MMDGSFVEAMQEAVQRPQMFEVDHEQRVFVPTGWSEHRREVPEHKPLTVGTLTSFAEFIKDAMLDSPVRATAFVHIASPSRVLYQSSVETVDGRYRRNIVLVASTDLVGQPPIQPGVFYDPETFVVGLQAWFVPTVDRAGVLKAVGNLRDSAVTTSTDDGVSQTVTGSRGIAMVDRIALPSPIPLRPYRTFREVEQPESMFLLRARPGKEGGLPTLALFEADGLMWKLAAMANVAAFLRAALPGVTVLA